MQFVLGVLGANAATIEQLVHMRRTAIDLFGADSFTWSAAGVGYPGQFHLAATALMLGGHMRVGLEDNLRVTAGRARRVERRAGGEGDDARAAAGSRTRGRLGSAAVARPAATLTV